MADYRNTIDVPAELEPGRDYTNTLAGETDDSVRGTGLRDLVSGGGGGDDGISGNGGDDILRGGGGDDFIWGDDGNDFILGGSGDDSIDGGPGDDLLYGGSGSDTFRFEPGDTGRDIVFDFNPEEDLIDLTAFEGIDVNRIRGDSRGLHHESLDLTPWGASLSRRLRLPAGDAACAR